MQVQYEDGEYKKSGSVLGEARKLIRVRSIRSTLALGRTHIPSIRNTIDQIQTTDEEVLFESELLHQIREFFKGDYEGEVTIKFTLRITETAVSGEANADFTPSDDSFSASVQTKKETEHEIQTIVADVLRLFLQYNIKIPEISCKSDGTREAYTIHGHGTLWVPTSLERSQENAPLVSEFPFSNVPFRRVLGL